MTEMGIQMELQKRKSGLMHRAITRKPRVDVSSKPTRYSSSRSDDSQFDDFEFENVNIDVSFSIEDVDYLQRDRIRGKEMRSFKHSIDIGSVVEKDPPPSERNETELASIGDAVSKLLQAQNLPVETASKVASPKGKLGRPRAMSVDNAFRHLPTAQDPSFPIRPEQSDIKRNYPDYDPGDQIKESYAEKLQYSAGTPRASKGKRVRTFFRRLAGSLESLLGIKRKSESTYDTDYVGPSPPVLNSEPGQIYHTAFSLPQRLQNTEVVASIEATISSQDHDVITTTGQSSIRTESADVRIQTGDRVYTPFREPLHASTVSLITPTPPRKPANKRHRARKNKYRRRHYSRRSSSEVTDVSNDWETRSDTDSEGYAFQSNRLTSLNDSIQSELDDSEKTGKEKPQNNEWSEENQAATSEPTTRPKIPVKISEFRPPGDFNKQMRRQRSIDSARSKGPMRALQPDSDSVISRSESTGKVDNTRKLMKRKVRRRNSSYVPCKAEKSPIPPSNPLKEAVSFEQIMSSINELADTLDKVSMSSNPKLHSVGTLDETTEAGHSSKATNHPKTEHKRLSRNQSWVGKVSNRLDNLIETKNDRSGMKRSSSADRPGKSHGQTDTSSPKQNRGRLKKKKSSVIHKEKVSFDELESDFRKFAQAVRGRQQSTERINTVGAQRS